MIILYSSKVGADLETIKKDVMAYKYLSYEDKYVQMGRAKYLCKKLADYALPPSKFEIDSKGLDKLEIANKRIKYKKLTYSVLRDALLHGAGAEMFQLTPDKKNIQAKRLAPERLILIQESEVDPPFMVLYWEPLPPQGESVTKDELNWFSDKKVWIDDGVRQVVYKGDVLVEEESSEHGLGIPAINVLKPFTGDVFYEDVKDLIEQYERTYGFLNKETKSTMTVLMSQQEIEAEQIQDWGNLRVISGINMLADGKPELLRKEPEYVGAFQFLDVAKKRINEEAGIVDLSSAEQAGLDPSGEALKIRLQPMEDKCSEIYPELLAFLNARHTIMANYLGFNYTEENANITLETNMPDLLLPKVQAYLQMMNSGIASKKTTQIALGFDPETEDENMKGEDGFNDLAQETFPTVQNSDNQA